MDAMLYERCQNTGPFQLSPTLKQGAPPEVKDNRLPNPLTNDTCRRHLRYCTVQCRSQKPELVMESEARARSHAPRQVAVVWY